MFQFQYRGEWQILETLQARKHLNQCPEAERSWSHCILYWLDLPVMPLVLDGIIYSLNNSEGVEAASNVYPGIERLGVWHGGCL